MGEIIGGRYRLSGKLGQGGMGEVWRAHDLRLDRDVAVKLMLRGGLFDGERARQRFEREARYTARIEHPAVPAVYDWGVDGPSDSGALFIVMELVRGETLQKLMGEDVVLPFEMVASVADQTADALACAHRLGLIHRDLKPSNLMITSDGRVKVLDFGIAAAVEPEPGDPVLTGTGLIPGTPGFIAPERVEGGPATPSSDLYALGCLLYRMLTGREPIEAANPMAMLYRHVHEAPEPVASRRADVPPELAALVDGLLMKGPESRPTAADVRSVALRCRPVAARVHQERLATPLRQSPRPHARGPLREAGERVSGTVPERLRLLRDLIHEEQYQEAYEGYHRLGATLRRTRPNTDREVLECRAGVAECLAGLGRTPEALADLERTLPVQEIVFGADSREAFESRFRIAELLARMGRTESAQEVLVDLRGRQSEVLSNDDGLQVRVAALLGRLDRLRGAN